MAEKEFTCVVNGIHAVGIVGSDIHQIRDYYVGLYVGPERVLFQFEMLMVATPPQYIVNRITRLTASGAQHTLVNMPERMSVVDCFEHVLYKVADVYKQLA